MNVFIRHYNNVYHWFASAAAQEMQAYQGSLEELAAFYRQHVQVKNWVLVAPAIDTAQRLISFTEKERRHIAKAVPFMLEDDLLSEASDLHYIADKISANQLFVVALDNTVLAGWLQTLEGAGIYPTHCLPEVKLLADSGSDWQIFYRQHEFIVHMADGQCMAFEQENFPLVLQLLTSNGSRMPSGITLSADDEAALQQAWASIPEALQALTEARILPYGSMLQSCFPAQAKTWNLLRGPFAYAQQWLGVLMPWRWVALAVLLVSSLHVAMVYVEYRQLDNESRWLRAEMETVFRQAIPKGQIVNHRKQLEHELEVLQQGGGAGNFMQKIHNIGAVFGKYQVQAMNSLNYEQAKNEIRIDVLVSDYDQLQQIINDLQAAGLSTEIQNSNAQGEQLRARIRITG